MRYYRTSQATNKNLDMAKTTSASEHHLRESPVLKNMNWNWPTFAVEFQNFQHLVAKSSHSCTQLPLTKSLWFLVKCILHIGVLNSD